MIVFRADGNPALGAGHIMRCLAIADAAKADGETCLFVTASNDLETAIKKHGHECLILNTYYSDMESENIVKALGVYRPSAIFVDSYYVTENYLGNLHNYCKERQCALVYIDDVYSFPYPCDILLNYNIYADADRYLKIYEGKKCPKLLIGTSYAPLRNEFRRLGERNINSQAQNIFVSTGGADIGHLSVALINAAKSEAYNFHFVVGSMNPDKSLIYNLSDGFDNIIIHENVARMSELMLLCDTAISAAGSTLYELCAAGTPSVTYILADNQIPGAEGFSSHGVMTNCGDIRVLGTEALAIQLIDCAVKLAQNYGKRCHISNLMHSIADGEGADRIIEAVLHKFPIA